MAFNTGKNRCLGSLLGVMIWAVLACGAELSAGNAIAGISFDDYSSILQSYVDDHGMVDYKGLKTNRQPLDNFVLSLSRLEAKIYDGWNDQATKFLKEPEKFRIDRINNKVYLSPIFDWFGQDFVKPYGTDKEFSGFSGKDRAVLNFVSRYLETEDKAFLLKSGFSIEYLNYDWSLNEKKI